MAPHPQAISVDDLNPIAELPSLLLLNLSGCQGLRDITPLSRLAMLQTLDLSYCCNIRTGFSALLGCGSLTDLNISSGCRNIPSEDLAGLAAWTQLESLMMPDGSYHRGGLPVAGWLAY